MAKLKAKKRLTNIELVVEIMEYSQFGALAQVFVMDALEKFSATVSEAKVSDFGENCMVHPQAWIGVAKEIKKKLAREEDV